jgi:quercetin dioxygenase-like cupin family protein
METGWHLHEALLYAYVLEGTLEVTYKTVAGTEITNTYNSGEAIMEALQTEHNGKNNTKSDIKILVVSIGSPDLENTVTLP